MAFWLATIKRLLSVSAVTGGYPVPQAREGSLGAIEPAASGPAQPRDVFERGQWWKNRVASRVDPLADVKRCACGNCSECVSRTYEDQMSAFRQTVSAVAQPETRPEPAVDGSHREDRAEAGNNDGKDNERKTGQTREDDLDTADRLLLARLKATDAAVKRHEQAHLAVAGDLARGGAHFEYRKGPDGKRYAVGGDVSIDVSRERDPEETIRKMERVRAAALAPAQPSPQDRRVAATADLIKLEAVNELRQQEMVELEEKRKQGGADISDPPVAGAVPKFSGMA